MRKFAEICAAVVLAGEVSLASAVLHGDWLAGTTGSGATGAIPGMVSAPSQSVPSIRLYPYASTAEPSRSPPGPAAVPGRLAGAVRAEEAGHLAGPGPAAVGFRDPREGRCRQSLGILVVMVSDVQRW
ncbi:hypothetical protein [Virgisporangium aliadipatigenens]|uniref:hypothetical protein n=1 Tax=Virgisporangium aliadipatigenens TaxID=741659 RepID=UPI001EF3AE77|nr:hypothetical protein [Virgisporangium aliadipatigenens]